MKNLFFVSAVGLELSSDQMIAEREIIEFVNHKVMEADVIPNEVYAGWAVHHGASDNPDFGAIVCIEDTEMAKRTALFLKERLCLGMYTFALNESLCSNQVFSTSADFEPMLEVKDVATRWTNFAKLAQSTYGIFVPAFMYADLCCVRIVGRLNPSATYTFGPYQEALEKIINCMNLDEKTFILPPEIGVANN